MAAARTPNRLPRASRLVGQRVGACRPFTRCPSRMTFPRQSRQQNTTDRAQPMRDRCMPATRPRPIAGAVTARSCLDVWYALISRRFMAERRQRFQRTCLTPGFPGPVAGRQQSGALPVPKDGGSRCIAGPGPLGQAAVSSRFSASASRLRRSRWSARRSRCSSTTSSGARSTNFGFDSLLSILAIS